MRRRWPWIVAGGTVAVALVLALRAVPRDELAFVRAYHPREANEDYVAADLGHDFITGKSSTETHPVRETQFTFSEWPAELSAKLYRYKNPDVGSNSSDVYIKLPSGAEGSYSEQEGWLHVQNERPRSWITQAVETVRSTLGL